MVVDGLLAFIVVWKLWRWPLWRRCALIVPFLVIDLVFFSANLLKLSRGRLGAAAVRRRVMV